VLAGVSECWAQLGWRQRRLAAPPPPPTPENLDFSVFKSAAVGGSTLPPGEIPPPPGAEAKGPPTVYYFDGRMHWCMLPDDRILVWSGSKWVPPGVIYWGASDTASARAAVPPGPWVHSRFNVESRNYRDRYGTDAWFRYGPGHFLD